MCYTCNPARNEDGDNRKTPTKPAISRSTDRETASCHLNSYPVRPASYHNRTSLERGSNDHQANHNNPSNRTIQTKKIQDAYVIGVHKALEARFGNRATYRGQEVADVIQYTIVELLGRISYIMGKYPDPAHYVGARLSNVVTDFGRRQAAQRGEGARYERKVASANEEHTARKIEQFVSGDSFDIADHLDKIALVKKVKGVLSAEQQRILDLVVVKGLSVTEVAKIVDKRRETVSRNLSDAKKRARKAIGPAS